MNPSCSRPIVSLAFLLSTLLASWASAAERPVAEGFDSPADVFAAYRQASNDRNYQAMFSLGTQRHQHAEILEMVLVSLPLAAESSEYQALLNKHGLPSQQLSLLYKAWLQLPQTDPEYQRGMDDITRRTAALIKRNVKDLPGLCTDIRKFGDKLSGNEQTIQELTQLKQTGEIAHGVATSTGRSKITVKPTGAPAYETTQSFTGTEELVFRRVGGRWFLSLDDDSAARFDNWWPKD